MTGVQLLLRCDCLRTVKPGRAIQEWREGGGRITKYNYQNGLVARHGYRGGNRRASWIVRGISHRFVHEPMPVMRGLCKNNSLRAIISLMPQPRPEIASPRPGCQDRIDRANPSSPTRLTLEPQFQHPQPNRIEE